MSPAVPPLLTMMRSRHRPLVGYGHTLHGDTLGSDNGARSVAAYIPSLLEGLEIRGAAPESIHPCALAPASHLSRLALASLEGYSSRSQPLAYVTAHKDSSAALGVSNGCCACVRPWPSAIISC